jgi:large subunit ribosomal protein L21
VTGATAAACVCVCVCVQVVADIEEQTKDPKIIVLKKKRRKGYRRKNGHRREVTVLRVRDVVVPDGVLL